MTSNIAKKRYPQTNPKTEFLKYCSPSAAALGEENQAKTSKIRSGCDPAEAKSCLDY